MFLPGELISMLTFPGIIVHEFAHMFFCKLRKVAVLEVCYFRFGNPGGYVVHENTSNFTSTFIISMGPFVINTLFCLLICLPAYIPINFFGLSHPWFYFLMWLGLSIGMHAIPSNQDADNVYQQAKEQVKQRNILAILSFPLVGLIYVFNALRILWSDLMHGAAIGIGIPYLIIG